MEHNHSHASSAAGPFKLALALTLIFALLEALGGWWANSLALLGDAGHMLSDTVALMIATAGAWFAQRPPSHKHSFGLGRAEVIAAVINVIVMFIVVVGISVEAVTRLYTPHPVKGMLVMILAAAGLAVNVLIAKILHGEKSLNAHAAYLHVIGDLLGSIAALTAGIVIYFTGWMPIDPLLSLFIGVLIMISSIRILRDSLHIVLEGVPRGLSLSKVGMSMAAIEGVKSVHDLHIWSLSSSEISLSAHIVIDDMREWQEILARLQKHLHENYQIDHTTLQPESAVLARVNIESLIQKN